MAIDKSRLAALGLIVLLSVILFSVVAFTALNTDTGRGLVKKVLDLNKKNEVAVIYIEGAMVADKASNSEGVACSSDIVRCLREAAKDPDVKAIVLRVNSPGGTPVAAEEIISQVEKVREKKPVVVSMGDIATSAAYYVSSATDRIVANPDTFTGSIGVIWVFKNRTKYYEDEGIDFYVAKSGGFKDVGADWRGLSENEKLYVQDIIQETYERFVQNVALGRNVSVDEIRKVADGRVFTGTRAKNMGLVDELGGLYDAVKIAADLAGVEGDVTVVHMNEPATAYQSKLTAEAL